MSVGLGSREDAPDLDNRGPMEEPSWVTNHRAREVEVAAVFFGPLFPRC